MAFGRARLEVLRRRAIGRVVLWVAAGSLGSACTSMPPPAAPAAAAGPAAVDYRSLIAAADKLDPNSPATLDARLQYAASLVDRSPLACGPELDTAQSELDLVARNPGTQV